MEIPLIAGEPMVCERHFWRLWPDNDPECPGPGMPLGAAQGYYRQLQEARGEEPDAWDRIPRHSR